MSARPNMKTSPKAVQNYVERLERQLAHQQNTIETLTRDATGADDWRGPFVAFIDGDINEPRIPLARQRESVRFVPQEGRRIDISVRWVPEDEALEIMDTSGQGAMLLQPQAANVVRIRKGPR